MQSLHLLLWGQELINTPLAQRMQWSQPFKLIFMVECGGPIKILSFSNYSNASPLLPETAVKILDLDLGVELSLGMLLKFSKVSFSMM